MIVFKYNMPEDYHKTLGKFRFIVFSNDKSIALNVWSKVIRNTERIEPSTHSYTGILLCVEDMTPQYADYHTSNAGAVAKCLGPELYKQLKVMLGEQSGLSGTKAQ